ncbi:MAG: hypothetical protein ISS36_01535 [Candidatus Aenigmarchaeota archaeon]|nr:hypothetical protein [Candidatus Aenigmarchaeota archaeon]
MKGEISAKMWWILGIIVLTVILIVVFSGSFSNFFSKAGPYMANLFKMISFGG